MSGGKRHNLQGQVVGLETKNIHLENEIERLQEQIEEYQKALDETTSENMDLHSIIKEVREYIEKHTTSYYTNIEETNEEFELICDPEELLEILDKVDKE